MSTPAHQSGGLQNEALVIDACVARRLEGCRQMSEQDGQSAAAVVAIGPRYRAAAVPLKASE